MSAIRINSRAIAVEADKYGATEYAIRSNGRDFLVTAHSRADAEHAAEYYRPETTDDSTTLLPGIPPSE